MKKRVFALLCDCLAALLLSYAVFAAGKNDVFAANRSAGKYVALTFDDGPHTEYTAQILDILKKYDAKATFFVIGQNAEKNPSLFAISRLSFEKVPSGGL